MNVILLMDKIQQTSWEKINIHGIDQGFMTIWKTAWADFVHQHSRLTGFGRSRDPMKREKPKPTRRTRLE